jgi:DNA repair protein RadC
MMNSDRPEMSAHETATLFSSGWTDQPYKLSWSDEDRDLLSTVTGLKQNEAVLLLESAGSLINLVQNGVPSSLKMSPKKKARINNIRPLIERLYNFDKTNCKQYTSARQFCEVYRARLGLLNYEELWMILLTHNLQIVNEVMIGKGTISNCPMDVHLVLSTVAQNRSTRIVFLHNHPSGSISPSVEDDLLTKRLCSILGMLNIEVLDHIIVSSTTSYFSYAESKPSELEPSKRYLSLRDTDVIE